MVRPPSSLISHPFYTRLSSGHRELVWSFSEVVHTLVPLPVLSLVLEDQPSPSSYSIRKPSLMLLVSSGCPSSCSCCTLHSSVTAPSTRHHHHSRICLSPSLDCELLGTGDYVLLICKVPALYPESSVYECNVCICMHGWMNKWQCTSRATSKLEWETTENGPGEGGHLTSRRAFWAAQYQARLTREASFWSDRGRKLRIYVSIWGKKTRHCELLELEAFGTFSSW